MHANLVWAFYSNARLEHDESDETVVAINYFLMNTPLRLILENFGKFFKLPPDSESNEKCPYYPALNVRRS